MIRCLRPGGLLVLAVPLCPSPLTAIPNHLVNLPPHHLSWWSAEAGATLCRVLGLEPLRIGPVPASPNAAVVLWMARLTLLRGGPTRPLRRGWPAMAATAFAYAGAGLLARVFGLPRGAAPIDVMMVARKPAG